MSLDKVIEAPKSIHSNNINARKNTDYGIEKYSTDDFIGVENTISLTDFLDFLNISCCVDNMIKNSVQPVMTSVGVSTGSKSSTNVDFDKLSKNRLINHLNREKPSTLNMDMGREIMHCKRRTSSADEPTMARTSGVRRPDFPRRRLHPKLQERLDHVLSEGILDPVLPYICPVPAPLGFSRQTGIRNVNKEARLGKDEQNNKTEDNNGNGDRNTSKPQTGSSRRKPPLASSSIGRIKSSEKKKPPEMGAVVIHVCDEVRNTSRDFFCQQNLLVSKMGYFADITAGQNLEDMDISVHCDIQIFDWLMRWIKYTAIMEKATVSTLLLPPEPQLDFSNVVPILVSANFLQMEPLLVDCLRFCHSHLSEIVRTSTNLMCLNESILCRLAAMFTNIELECVRDKKERITPRLWTKLIQSLCEPESEALRGHYFSLAGLFRCSKCGKVLTKTMQSYVSCVPSNVRINRWGQRVSYHIGDDSFSMSAFIAHLFKELMSWRLVYWKLWGHCHYLYCITCDTHFPLYQLNWCRYHSEVAQFPGAHTEGSHPVPIGRYPCCGEQAFRFETLPLPVGCQFREHSVLIETVQQRDIFSIAQLVYENEALCEAPTPAQVRRGNTCRDLETSALLLAPCVRERNGLLPLLNADESKRHSMQSKPSGRLCLSDVSVSSETVSSDDEDIIAKKNGVEEDNDVQSASSDSCESVCKQRQKKCSSRKYIRKRQTEKTGRHWFGELSARSNQDHQRDFEEKVMRKVVAIVGNKATSEHSLVGPPAIAPLGGVYVRLEAEWRDGLKQRGTNTVNTVSNSSSNANIGNKQKK